MYIDLNFKHKNEVAFNLGFCCPGNSNCSWAEVSLLNVVINRALAPSAVREEVVIFLFAGILGLSCIMPVDCMNCLKKFSSQV